jgi:wobble nucleotide-excising tRNase
MVERIDKIKSFGPFKNFKWNNNILDFRQYNLLYGWNYSGKTMLSRMFRCIELNELHSDFPDAEFELTYDRNNKIRHERLDNSPYRFRVFNTDFVRDNLQWDNQEANPLFILGKEDIELQKQIKALKEEVENLQNEKEENEKEKTKIEDSIEKKLTTEARKLDRIKPPYDKRKLRNKLKEIQSNPKNYCLNENEISKLQKMVNSSPLDKLLVISIAVLTKVKLIEIEKSLKKTVISQTIERLESDPEVNSWVRKGLDLHKGKNKCEFCSNPLPENLLETYEKHFSKEYEDLIKELKTLSEYLKARKISVSFPDERRLYPHLETQYKNVKSKFENCINEYNKNIEKLINLIDEKSNNPFKKLDEIFIYAVTNCVNNKCLEEINKIINKHNSNSDNFEKTRKEAFGKLELHYAYEFDKENLYFDTLNRLYVSEKEINQKNEDTKKKEKEISQIEVKLSDIAKAANKINQYLKNIFGKEHIKIKAIDKNKFKILRSGRDATNLSEGEKTAVAFSYFMTRLEDKETDIFNAIIFIDDPISSLDSNHLYNTFAVVQAKLENCKQLFVSTHNLEFFNLLKEWLKKIRGNKDKCRYYLIERITKNGNEISDIRKLPSLLLNFKSEYHFLFYKIKSFADNPSVDFESLYQLPNIIRRFLEAFIGFKFATGLKKGLKLIIIDDSECIKANKFINNLSHQTGLSRSLVFCDINECKRIVDIVLEAVKRKDSEHYRILEDIYRNHQDNDD